MPRLLLVTVIIAIALLIFALVDISLTPAKSVRSLRKFIWIFVVIIPIVGPALWFVLGRPRKSTERRGPTIYGAPDDDPDFLRSLKRDEEQERRIRELEEELNKLDDDDSTK